MCAFGLAHKSRSISQLTPRNNKDVQLRDKCRGQARVASVTRAVLENIIDVLKAMLGLKV